MEYSRQSRTTASNDSGYYRRLAHEDSSDEVGYGAPVYMFGIA